jgi:hypothetical protein
MEDEQARNVTGAVAALAALATLDRARASVNAAICRRERARRNARWMFCIAAVLWFALGRLLATFLLARSR